MLIWTQFRYLPLQHPATLDYFFPILKMWSRKGVIKAFQDEKLRVEDVLFVQKMLAPLN